MNEKNFACMKILTTMTNVRLRGIIFNN